MYYLKKLDLTTARKRYFEIEEKRIQEKHNAEQLRAQEWGKVHYELKIKKFMNEINNFKKVIIGNILLPYQRISHQ